MRYFGIAFGAGEYAYSCALEEVRTPEPPVRLRCEFYEPGSWGPQEAERLVAHHGGWHGPWMT